MLSHFSPSGPGPAGATAKRPLDADSPASAHKRATPNPDAGSGFSTPRARRPLHNQLSVGGERPAKLFFDPVHGTMSYEEVCLRIIDTPQFQRLRGIKQLGACDFVFPGACHSRFDHSLGTGHLAGRLAQHLRQAQPHLALTSIDVLCVKLAGLCHDIGHGAFSHVYDGVFMPRVAPGNGWAHEQASVDMFRFMLEDNGISLAAYGLSEADEAFITEMILGTPEAERRGRARDKMFLYDIVNNARSGLDVDKLDYFQRDARYTGLDAKCDFARLMELSRVANVVDDDGETRRTIAFPEKLVKEVFSVFRTRFDLHQAVYTHKVVKAIEYMIVDILVMANDVVRLTGRDGAPVRMSEAFRDMAAYAKLKDSILDFIDLSVDPRLEDARALLRRLRLRDVYQCVGQSPVPLYSSPDDPDEWYNRPEEELAAEIAAMAPAEQQLLPEHIIAELMHIHHGKRAENPVDRVRFFPKEALHAGGEIVAERVDETKYECLLPRTFEDRALRLFVRRADKAEAAREAFERWCERNQCPSPFPSQCSQSQ